MVFLIEYTTSVYKWQYAMTKRLKELYPDARFIAMINSASQHELEVENYILKGDVVFEEVINAKKYMSRYTDEKEIDYDFLNRFEQTIPEKSLWRLIIIDRDWGSPWVKTAVRPLSYLHTINHDQDNILRMSQHLIKLYERLFTQYKINVVLPSNGMNSINCAIMERVALNHGTHYLVAETIRALGYFSFASNKEQNFPHIDRKYVQLLNDPHADLSTGEDIYSRMMEDLKKEEYYDKLTLKKFKATAKLKYLIKVPLKIVKAILEWFSNYPERARTETIFRQANDWPTFWSNLKYAAMRPYQVMTLMDPKFFGECDLTKKYVYFPLSSSPEHSTQVKAPMWVNQSVIIEALSKSIPAGWLIYIKEHPQNLLCRVRDFRFYEEIKRYPNVRLIPTDSNFFNVIKSAQLVVNITGTTGWQAIQFNKPVINFGDNFSDVMGLSVRCSDIEGLSRAIHQAIAIAQSVPLAERQRRMACLLTALMKHSFWSDHPWKVIGDIVANEEDSLDIGLKVANCLYGYLEEAAQEKVKGKLVHV